MLELMLLGQPQILLDEQPLTTLLAKAQALLFYLVVTGQPQTRDHLADLLWQGSDAARARDNLRHELETLRRHFAPYLEIEREQITFRRDSHYRLDLEAFLACFPTRSPQTQALMETAVQLYRGPFLDKFKVRQAPQFEMWVEQQRAYCEPHAIAAFDELVRRYAAAHRHDDALRCAERWRDLLPDAEDPHRALVVLLALAKGDKAALAYYERVKASVEFSPTMEILSREVAAGRASIDMLEAHWSQPVARPASRETPVPFLAPRVPPAFVGRRAELDKLYALMSRSTSGLIVALVGMGGIGKTSLATRLAHDLRDVFPDGVLWADLATSSPRSVLELWGEAYGTSQLARYPDLGTRAAAFRKLMEHKRALLVLDDVAAAAEVSPLLPTSTDSVVLITTRNHDIPAMYHAHIAEVKGLKRKDSLDLMARIIGDKRVRAELDNARRILRLLGGLPLAIDITAQRINRERDRPLARTLQQLENINSRLSQLKIADTEVRASFERSWDELESDWQRVFRLMGVFDSRPFSRQAIAHVAAIIEDDANEASISLCQLSLLTYLSEGRYRLHPLLADYAREKLDASDDAAAARLRMAHFYQRFAQDHQHSPAILDEEWGNLMAGVHIAYERKQWRLLIRYSEILEKVWFSLGHFSDARQIYDWLCNSDDVLAEDGAPALAKRLSSWGLACIEQSDYDTAHQHLTRAHEIYEELRMEGELARTKGLLGRVAGEREDFDTAEPLLRESHRLCEARGDWVGAFEALYLYADVPFRERRYDELYQIADQLQRYSETAAFTLGRIKQLGLLADVTTAEGKYADAEQYCLDALALCDEVQEQTERSVILFMLASVYKSQKRFDEAFEIIERSLSMFYRMGDTKMQARATWRKALIHIAAGQNELASQTADESLHLAQLVNEHFYQRFLQYKRERFVSSE
ncbi:MAG: NB-ARC domain-containing protein [Anaerolineae bacterium]